MKRRDPDEWNPTERREIEHAGTIGHRSEDAVLDALAALHGENITDVEAIEDEGGSINAATGYERTSFQVRALADGLDLGSAVIGDLLLRPTVDAGDLAREKQVVAQEIAEAADAPDDLVFEMAQTKAYADQPLGRPILGTTTSIGGADPEALLDWRGQLYAPGSLIVSFIEELDKCILGYFSFHWKCSTYMITQVKIKERR